MNTLNGKTVLLTGGAGFIGSNLSVKLLECEINKLIILDDLSSGHDENIPKDERIEFACGSVDDEEILFEVFSQPIDIIFHLAANFANQNSVDYPQKDLRVNGIGTLKLLEYAKRHGIKKIVYTSSSCVYGNKPGELKVETKEYSLETPYAITKLLGERYMTFFHEHYGLNVTIIRYFNVFGPGERPGKYRNVIPNFIYMAINKQALTVCGKGEETRDFNFVDNAVAGTIATAISEKSNGRIYNLGTGRETRIIEIAEIINRVTNNTAGIEFIPMRSWDNTNSRRAGIKEAIEDLGYCPVVDLEGQIENTYRWIYDLYRKRRL